MSPNWALPPAGRVPFQAALRTVTVEPDTLSTPPQTWLID